MMCYLIAEVGFIIFIKVHNIKILIILHLFIYKYHIDISMSIIVKNG